MLGGFETDHITLEAVLVAVVVSVAALVLNTLLYPVHPEVAPVPAAVCATAVVPKAPLVLILTLPLCP